MELTEEQKKRMAENRRKALAILRAKQGGQQTVTQPIGVTTSRSTPVGGTTGGTNYVVSGYSSQQSMTKIKPYVSRGPGVPAQGPYSRQTTALTNTEPKRALPPALYPARSSEKVSAKLCLRSRDRFEIVVPYNKSLIEEIKKIPSASWDVTKKVWHFDVDQYTTALTCLSKAAKRIGVTVEVDKEESIPSFLLAILRQEKKVAQQEIDLTSKISSYIVGRMLDFQKEGVIFGIRRNGRCLIADEMGLGKTMQAIGLATWFKEDWPLLVVAPASVLTNWKNSILEWMPFVSKDQVEVMEGVTGNKDFPKTSIVILSYTRLDKFVHQIIDRRMKFVILDESHSIKSDLAQRTQAALAITKEAKRVVLLSGTPALSRPMELFTQINAINPRLFPKKHEFGMRYCDGKEAPFARGKAGSKFGGKIYDYKGASHTDELKVVLDSTIMIRRLKKDVLKELNAKERVRVNITLDLNDLDETRMSNFGAKIESTQKDKVRRELLMDWYHKTAELKKEKVAEYVNNLLNKDQKFICFAYHKQVIEEIASTLTSRKVTFIKIDGSTDVKYRQECCDFFQEKEHCRVALVSILAAGVGITLTAAHLVVFAELYWNPGILVQAEDRAHRIGQTKKVVVEYLVAGHTADEYIWKMVTKKLNVLDSVGLTTGNFSESGATTRDANQQTLDRFLEKMIREDPLSQSLLAPTKDTDEDEVVEC